MLARAAVIVGLTLLVACSNKPTEPGVPFTPRVDILSTTFWVDDQVIDEGGDESGAQNGVLVDPTGPLVLVDLDGDDCSTSLVVHNALLPFLEDDRPVASLPLSFEAPTVASPLVKTFGFTSSGEKVTYVGGSYRLLPQEDPIRWEIEVTTDELCTAPNGIDEPVCGPQDVPIRIEVRVNAPGAGQIGPEEAATAFDVVPSEHMTFEGMALPPCVPVQR